MQLKQKYSYSASRIWTTAAAFLINTRILIFLAFLLASILRDNPGDELLVLVLFSPFLFISPLVYLICHIKFVKNKELIPNTGTDYFYFGNKGKLKQYTKSDIVELQYHKAPLKSARNQFESVDIVFKRW